MKQFSFFPRCALVLGTALLSCTLSARVRAASRPGAPRLLVVETGALADDQSITQPCAGRWKGKMALLFVRQSEGARNLWLATSDAPVANKDAKEFEWAGRNTRWTARPLTQLSAPFSVQNPAFTRDGRILCTINAPTIQVAPNVRNKPGRFRLAILDVGANALEFLTPARDDVNGTALSPDGNRVAFSAQRAGRLAIFWTNLNGGPQYQIATEARLSGWLDANTLLYRSTRPGRGGLYRTNPLREEKDNDKAPLSARLLLADGRDAAISPDGRTICAVVATDNRNGVESETDATQLVYLSADGSGARVLKGTEGATHPAFTPDGNAIIYEDAAPSANSSASNDANNDAESDAARALWAMPMLRVPPVALLSALRPATVAQAAGKEGVLSLIGTAYSEENGPLEIKIEAGSGSEPTRWTTVGTRQKAAQNETLTLWTPPDGARDDWSLRLTVRDAAGDWAQSVLPVTLPLFAPLNPQAIAPTAPTVPVKANPQPPTIAPSRTSETPRRPIGSEAPNLPLDALPPPPAAGANPIVSPRAAFENSGINPGNSSPKAVTDNNTLPPFPVGALRAPEARPGESAPPPTFNPPVAAPVAPKTKKTPPKRVARDSKTDDPDTATNPVQAPTAAPAIATVPNPNQRERGRLQIEAPPANVRAGQSITVAATVFNTGDDAWKLSDAKPVRVFYRWVNRDSELRNWWSLQWLGGDLVPGANREMTLSSLFKPARPGRYRLSIGLMRMARENPRVPKATDAAAQKLWPGEFATNTYDITVTP